MPYHVPVASRYASKLPELVAAVDLGSNSFHMLVARFAHGQLTVIDRLREMEEAGEIGSLADYHYSFMGSAGGPEAYEKSAIEVAGLLKDDQVDAVLFSPV